MDTKDTLRLKRERGVVLASQLVKELAQGKVSALRRAEVTTPTPDKPSVRVRAYQREYIRLGRLQNKVAVRLKRLGWYMSGGRQLHPQGVNSNARRAAHAQKQQRLVADVQVLRTHALTELIVATPHQAQVIVRKFQHALQAITL